MKRILFRAHWSRITYAIEPNAGSATALPKSREWRAETDYRRAKDIIKGKVDSLKTTKMLPLQGVHLQCNHRWRVYKPVFAWMNTISNYQQHPPDANNPLLLCLVR